MFNLSFSIRLFTAIKLKNGKHPVVLQVIFRNPQDTSSNVRRKRLGLEAFPEQWDQDRFRTSANNGREYNYQLDEMEERAWMIYNKHFQGRTFRFKQFSDLFDQKHKKMDLRGLMNEIKTELTLQDRVGTAMSYQCAVNSAYKFAGVKNLMLTDIDAQWLREYEKYNLAKGNKCNVYMRSLKTLFGRAVERGYIEPNEIPFKTKYQPRGYCFAHLSKVTSKKKLTKRIRILSIEEMSLILKYKPTSPALERAHDIFLFSYLNMGVDLKDIALLQMKDIRNGLWYHQRQKSGVDVKGKPITEAALEILKKYNRPEHKYVFNFVLGTQYDESELAIKKRIRDFSSNLTRRYKLISDDIGLDGYYSINSARHTSATICKQLGGDIKAISNLLNHKSIQTTNNYIGDPRREQMKIALERLKLNFVD
jgi:integrase/recombinase XerD